MLVFSRLLLRSSGYTIFFPWGDKFACKRKSFSTGTHPRILVDSFEIAKRATLQYLEKFKTPVVVGDEPDKEILKMVARTTLRTKVHSSMLPQYFPPFLT